MSKVLDNYDNFPGWETETRRCVRCEKISEVVYHRWNPLPAVTECPVCDDIALVHSNVYSIYFGI